MSAGAQINLFKQSRAARSFREAGVQFWRRTIDSFPPAHSPRYLRGFDRLAASFPARHVLCSSRRRKKNTRRSFDLRVVNSGDVLLSHGLSPYYHRGCSVSLPCSEWERVGPLRYCHQSAVPHWQFRCCRSDASAKPSLWGRLLILGEAKVLGLIVRSLGFARDDKSFSKNKFCQFSDIYIQEAFSDSRFSFYDSRVGSNFKASFSFLRSFVSSVGWNPERIRGHSVTEK